MGWLFFEEGSLILSHKFLGFGASLSTSTTRMVYLFFKFVRDCMMLPISTMSPSSSWDNFAELVSFFLVLPFQAVIFGCESWHITCADVEHFTHIVHLTCSSGAYASCVGEEDNGWLCFVARFFTYFLDIYVYIYIYKRWYPRGLWVFTVNWLSWCIIWLGTILHCVHPGL